MSIDIWTCRVMTRRAADGEATITVTRNGLAMCSFAWDEDHTNSRGARRPVRCPWRNA